VNNEWLTELGNRHEGVEGTEAALLREIARLNAEKAETERHLNEILAELRAIDDAIPYGDKAKLSGSPALTDVMKNLLRFNQELQQDMATALDGYRQQRQALKECKIAAENALEPWITPENPHPAYIPDELSIYLYIRDCAAKALEDEP
jgi:chromosome segregation ATPase